MICLSFLLKGESYNFSNLSAPHWNKPKVEEQISIYNMPGGISQEFLKIVIPDAITWTADTGNAEYR